MAAPRDTCRALAESQEASSPDETRVAAARQLLAECDARLARYREALESGVDPAVVGGWIREVQAERRKAERELRRRPIAVLSEGEIAALVESLDDLAEAIEAAASQKKADLYESLGLSLTYRPDDRKVLVEVDLSDVRMVRVGGRSGTLRTPLLVRGEFRLAA